MLSVMPLDPRIFVFLAEFPLEEPLSQPVITIRIQCSHGTSLAFQRVEANFEGKEAV